MNADKQASVIVTGASGALGGTISQVLKSRGYRVIGTTSSGKSIGQLASLGIEPAALDLANEAEVEEFVTRKASGATAAILTVGGFAMGGFTETDGEALRHMYSLNFETAYFLVRALLPQFGQQGGGHFIFIGSRPALEPKAGKNLIAYSLSKSLIFHLAELVEAYGSDKNIRATVIVPSIIDTPANRGSMPDADFSKWVSSDAIAETVAFLLSEAGQQVRQSVIKLYNEA